MVCLCEVNKILKIKTRLKSVGKKEKFTAYGLESWKKKIKINAEKCCEAK